MIGERLRRLPDRSRCRSSPFRGLADIPVLGPLLFGQDALVYLSLALTVGVGLVPQAHARRADPAGGRRERRFRAFDRLSRDRIRYVAVAVRRRHGRPRAAPTCRWSTRRCGSRA